MVFLGMPTSDVPPFLVGAVHNIRGGWLTELKSHIIYCPKSFTMMYFIRFLKKITLII